MNKQPSKETNEERATRMAQAFVNGLNRMVMLEDKYGPEKALEIVQAERAKKKAKENAQTPNP